jgi:hypothetical protein
LRAVFRTRVVLYSLVAVAMILFRLKIECQ